MITVFTPTYNRVDKLLRLYKSLLKQSCFDFEWLIIDDGSTDTTEAVVRNFTNTAFDIRYYKKENGGKHIAYNLALEHAGGNYFLCVDSDDWLVDDAIQILAEQLEKCETRFILSYKIDEKGNMLSGAFPEKVTHLSLQELNNCYGCIGEFTIVLRTEFARKYPFPLFKGERFLTEAVIYDRISLVEEVSLIPHVITICEYQTDGLTNNLNRIMKFNPAGYCLFFMQRIDLANGLKTKTITAGKYNCFCLFAKEKMTKYDGKNKLMVLLTKPVGYLFWIYYKIWRRF